MRIQKYFSQNKIMSRREAEDYIRRGLISVNGKVVREMGVQIDPEKDKIKVLTADKSPVSQKITVAVYKPRGIVCSKNNKEGRTIFELFPQFAKLNAVGRLDKDSEGLIFLSNDGVITSAITGSEHKIEKEYEVGVQETVKQNNIKKMETGIELDDGMTLPAKAKILSPRGFKIILKEGRKHQIRRMCSALNLTVVKLKRVRVGNIFLKGIPLGGYRQLSQEEAEKLKKLAK